VDDGAGELGPNGGGDLRGVVDPPGDAPADPHRDRDDTDAMCRCASGAESAAEVSPQAARR